MASSSPAQRIEVRRLNNDELHYIQTIQREARDILAYYNGPDHEHWLRKAIGEIGDGARVAFGAFIRSTGSPGFVGSAIVKKAARQGHAELKNFVIDKTHCDDKTQLTIQVHLLSSIEKFCSNRGFTAMEIEFPADLIRNISFFLDNKYRVTGAIESRYRRGDYHYVLEKKLDKLYSDDPFDYLTISRWLVHEYFEFPKEEADGLQRATDKSGDINNSFIFRVAPITNDSNQNDKVTGACMYEYNDQTDSKPDRFAKTEFDLKILVTKRPKIEYAKFKDKLKLIDPGDIKRMFGEKSTINLLPMDIKDVTGVLIAVGSNFRDRIKFQTKQFSYIVGSGMGHQLATSPLVEDARTFAVFCTERVDPDTGVGIEVWGISTIKSFSKVDLQSIIDRKKWNEAEASLGQIWTSDEVEYYLNDAFSANHTEYHRVSLLELEPPVLFDVASEYFTDRLLSQTVSGYLKAVSDSGFSCCYLDNDSVLQILQYAAKMQKPKPLSEPLQENENDKLMISTIIEAIEIIGGLTKIGSFTIDQIKGLTKSLRSSEKNDPIDEKKNSRIKVLVDVVVSQLDEHIREYKSTGRAKDSTTPEKNKQVVIIASKALKVLEASVSIKSEIPEYDAMVGFFKSAQSTYDS